MALNAISFLVIGLSICNTAIIDIENYRIANLIVSRL